MCVSQLLFLFPKNPVEKAAIVRAYAVVLVKEIVF
jgi:hypothetical protein